MVSPPDAWTAAGKAALKPGAKTDQVILTRYPHPYDATRTLLFAEGANHEWVAGQANEQALVYVFGHALGIRYPSAVGSRPSGCPVSRDLVMVVRLSIGHWLSYHHLLRRRRLV